MTSSYGTARFTGVSYVRGGDASDQIYGTSGPQTLVGGGGDTCSRGTAVRTSCAVGTARTRCSAGPAGTRAAAEREDNCER